MSTADRTTMIVAIALAVLLWAYVRLAQDTPDITRVIKDVPVRIVGTIPSGYGVKLHENDQAIDIYVKGSVKEINELTDDKVRASIDISGITRAKSVVTVRDIELPPGIRLARKSKVTLLTYSLSQRTMPVRVAFVAQPPPGSIVGEYQMQPSSVTVEGQADDLRRVRYVTVRIDPNVTFTEGEAPLRAVDIDGERVEEVTVIPPSARVTLASPTGKQTTRQVAVGQPELKNQPRHYTVRVARIRPEVVTLRGESALLDRVEGFVASEAIDVSHVVRDTTVTVRLRVPRGLSVVEGPSVRVDLEAQPMP